jgi:general stress protein 26
MEKKEALSIIKELFENSEICCYLTTLNSKNLPETRAMMNLRNRALFPNLVDFFKNHNDDFLIYFSTNTSSPKVNQIKNNSNVCVYISNPKEYKGCMLCGRINIINDQNIKNSLWQDNWTIYYPGGMTDTDYTVLELKPKLLKVYHQLGTFTIDKE